MKRLIAAGILLFSVISAYLTGYFYIDSTCDKAAYLLESCVNAYNSGTDAEAKASELEKFWEEKEKPLSFFANHKEIDDIELAISALKIYSTSESSDRFNEYSGTVETLLHQLTEDIVPTIHSIF